MGFIFVYDCTNPTSFKDILSYIQVIHDEETKEKGRIPSIKMIIGNKIDLGFNTVT